MIIHSAENFDKVPNPRWPPLKMTDNCYFAPDKVGNITMHYYVSSKCFMREDMSYQYLSCLGSKKISSSHTSIIADIKKYVKVVFYAHYNHPL